nr:hypothetical protein [Tanacetum cinerariifolium]
MSKRSGNIRGQSSTSREVSLEERIHGFRIFENGVPQMLHDTLATRPIHPKMLLIGNSLPAIILIGDSSRASNPILSPALSGRTYSKSTNVFIVTLFMNYLLQLSLSQLLLGMILSTKVLSLGWGEERKISLLELSWRIGLYSEDQSREDNTRSKLNRAVNVKEMRLLMEFWQSIRDGEFTVGNTSVNKVRDPRVKVAHRCIAATILGVMEKNVISGGMFVTRIARSYRLLTREMMNALSVEHRPYVFKKKSLIAMGIVMELHGGACYWPMIREAGGDDEAEEATEGGVGGSADAYRDMSRGDWQPVKVYGWIR